MPSSALLALVLSTLGPGPDAVPIARAIVTAVEDRADRGEAPLTEAPALDAVLLAVYARHESGASVHPRACSWDAKAGRSVGAWQMPSYMGALPLEVQAGTWLRWAREGGLAALDSSPARARQRLTEARAALTAAVSGQ